MKLYHLNAEAQQIAEQIVVGITDSLAGDESKATKHIGAKEGAYMRLSVECLHKSAEYTLFSFAHYYEQNGDLMRDPDVVFKVSSETGKWFPVEYTQDNVGLYQDFLNEENERAQKGVKDFCNQWMINIMEQHPEYFEALKAA